VRLRAAGGGQRRLGQQVAPLGMGSWSWRRHWPPSALSASAAFVSSRTSTTVRACWMGSHSSALLAADSGIPPRRAAHTECRATGRSVAGKSTLADRLLQMCGVLDAEQTQGDNAQFLDQLEVERARGITVKAMHASLLHSPAARAEGGPTDTPLGAGLRLRDVRAPPPPLHLFLRPL
jgi:hypothetical protein